MSGPTIEQVDAAVRAVLAGRGRSGLGCDADGETFGGPLLSLRHAEGLAPGARQIRVSPGTVVTPLARDLLKRRGIVLRVVSSSEAKRAGQWGLAMETESGVAQALKRALLSGPEGWIDLGDSVVHACRWLLDRDDRGAAVLTDEASVAAWKANGTEGIRAATVADASAVERAVRHLGINLLVIEPAGKSIHELGHWLKVFRRGGAPNPPAGLSRRGPELRAEFHADRGGDRPGHALSEPPQPAERALRDRLALAARGLDGGRPGAW